MKNLKILFSNLTVLIFIYVSILHSAVDEKYLFQLESATQAQIDAFNASNLKKGMIIYNSTDDKVYDYNGTDWVQFKDAVHSGMTGSVFFADVKSTSCKFEQRMIFSGQEFKFINQNTNYLIHRVFNLKESPKLKVCGNVKNISNEFVPNLNSFTTDVMEYGLRINSVKVEVPPMLENLTFGDEILLT